MSAASSASIADRNATIGDLSSEVERPNTRHCGSMAPWTSSSFNVPAGRRQIGHDDRRKRRCMGPFARIDRLAVVVKVEGDGPLCVWNAAIRNHQRRAAGRHRFRQEAPLLEHPCQSFGIAGNVGGIRGDVGNRHQVEQLAKNLRLVLDAPGANPRHRVIGRRCKQKPSWSQTAAVRFITCCGRFLSRKYWT